MRAELGAGPVESVDLAAWFTERLEASIMFVEPGVGFVEVAPPAELVALYVVPLAWGTGVAGALHDRALDELRAAGARSVCLTVIAKNARARRFYARRGWLCTGDDAPRMFGAVELAFVRYELAL